MGLENLLGANSGFELEMGRNEFKSMTEIGIWDIKLGIIYLNTWKQKQIKYKLYY